MDSLYKLLQIIMNLTINRNSVKSSEQAALPFTFLIKYIAALQIFTLEYLQSLIIFNYMHEDHKPTEQSAKPAITDQHISNFIIAIKTGQKEKIHECLNTFGNDIVNRIQSQTRQPSIYFSAVMPNQEDSLEIMKLLLNSGANPHFKDQNQQTVMFYACRQGKKTCVDLLLTKGLSLQEQDAYGQTPLYYAASENRLNVLEKFRDLDIFNHKDKLAGQTALFYAARKGHLDMCKALIDLGSDPTINDNYKKLATDYARKAKFTDVADFLAAQVKKAKQSNKMSNQVINQSSQNEKKRRKQGMTAKQNYKIVLMKDNGQLHDLTQEEVRQLLKDNQLLQGYLANPQSIPQQQMERAQRNNWEKVATKVLNNIWKLKGSFWFYEPVDTVKFNIMDYFDIITNPMDLGTLKKKLNHNAYTKADEFVADMRLIFSNCYRYNGEAHDISKAAKEVQIAFEEQLKSQGLDKFLSNDA